MKNLFLLILAGIIGGIVTLSSYKFLGLDARNGDGGRAAQSGVGVNTVSYKGKAVETSGNMVDVSFGKAAERSLEEVVHIRATVSARRGRGGQDPFHDFFGFEDPFGQDPRQESLRQQATGSGVIFRQDGYVVTNNHVVDGATDLEVSLHNKRVYKAKLIGTDPSTDLAVIKISEDNLPAATFANSDQVNVGDWVLAVGNPFDLASTVTAGIISAKARSIGIREDNTAIESYLQTDAAVNPGNSGGALVNLRGELVGINTAIASPTGTYAGYAFAVPSNLVSKVVEDLMRFGEVKRPYLGVGIRDLDWPLAQDLGLKISEGVLVERVAPGGAAQKAGIEQQDVIVEVDKRAVRSSAELLETVARHRPGDKINIIVNRQGKERQITVTLRDAASVAQR